MNQCKFDKAWIGPCDKDVFPGKTFCEEHENIICCSCGDKATKQCDATGGLVCGYPLCDKCVHGPSNGYSFLGLGGGHVKKENLRVCPKCHWYINLVVENSDKIICNSCKIESSRSLDYVNSTTIR